MEAPNLVDASVLTRLEPADITLRGSRDTEIDKLIALWLPAWRIDFEPCTDWRQSYMTEVNTPSKPRMIAGSSRTGSKAATKDVTQLPQVILKSDTVDSQLVL